MTFGQFQVGLILHQTSLQLFITFFPLSPLIDDVFLPKEVDPTEMDEIDREVEYFKR